MKKQQTIEQFCQEHGLPEPTQIIGALVKITFLPLKEQTGDAVGISRFTDNQLLLLRHASVFCRIENFAYCPEVGDLALFTNKRGIKVIEWVLFVTETSKHPIVLAELYKDNSDPCWGKLKVKIEWLQKTPEKEQNKVQKPW